MEITHKTTIVDKIRELKQEGGLNQRQLAEKIGVSQKTISLWVRQKTKPSVRFEDKITALHNNLVIDKGKKTRVRQIIEGVQAREADSDYVIYATDEEREYYEAKQFIEEVEKENDSRVYLFPAKGNINDEWYKVAGKSLLFYKYYLAPRLGREVNFQADTDKHRKFKYGVGSIRWGNRLIDEVNNLGYKAEKIDFNIIVVELNKKYTKKEIRELIELSESDRHKAQRMIKPKENYPKMIAEINELNRLLPPKVKKMDEPYRSIYGPELLRPAVELVKIYHRMANGRMDKRDAKLEMLERSDDLAAMLSVMDENNLIPMAARTRMGENILRMRLEIEETL